MSFRLTAAYLRIVIAFTAFVVAIPVASIAAESLQLPDGSKVDLSKKCPVCGMVVGGRAGEGVTLTFKDGRVIGFHGVAAAVFKDGHVVGFEGARCLFIYNSVPQKYAVSVSDIERQYVTDFSSKKMIELSEGFLVLGSEVKGPMGYELIAFSNMEEAAKFASEHDGKWIVQLREVARASQDGTEEPAANSEIDAKGVEEKTRPAQAAEPESVEPKPRTEKAKGRAAPERIRDIEPNEPPVGGDLRRRGGRRMH